MPSLRALLLAAAAASVVSAGSVLLADPARAQRVSLSCADFRRKADGSWTPVRKSVVVGPRGAFTVEPGEVFYIQLQGTTNYGAKVAEALNTRCR